ncbi:hypothetical protein NPIL_171891 [Nephila pilipes]|uniref:Uncharacterized protein n=1 Tax=Nephila pilipes TaxID=299642 RepID=A0A8X6PZM9_NEPPI|nr:hypothetical protein NPIL_171891 [Nephila pilipes]
MTTLDCMSHRWSGTPYSDKVGKLSSILCAIHLNLGHPITTCSNPWTIIILEKFSPKKQTCAKHSHTSLRPTPPLPLVFPQGDCTAGYTLANGAGCRW